MLQTQLKRLETEINDAEARLRLHDDRLAHSIRRLRERTVEILTSKKVVIGGTVLGGALTAGAAWLVRNRSAHRHDVDDEFHQPSGRLASRRLRRLNRRRAGLFSVAALAQQLAPVLLPALTPLLNRRVASVLAKLGAPIDVKPLASLPTVEQLDVNRYAGPWQQVAYLPNKRERECARNVTVDYRLDDRGGLTVEHRCVDELGATKILKGVARIPDEHLPGQLELSFSPSWLRWWPGAWSDAWVLEVDDDYQVALVGTPDRNGLWMLSRSPTLSQARFEAFQALAQRHGFDTSRLIKNSDESAVSEGRDGL